MTSGFLLFLLMKNIFISLLIFFCLFASCQTGKKDSTNSISNKKENVDGGSCSYEHQIYPAIILWIDSTNVEDCDLQLYRPTDLNDTIYYSMKNHSLLKLETIHAEKLKTGDTIIYQQSHIIEGSCNPFIERILVKKYSKKD